MMGEQSYFIMFWKYYEVMCVALHASFDSSKLASFQRANM